MDFEVFRWEISKHTYSKLKTVNLKTFQNSATWK